MKSAVFFSIVTACKDGLPLLKETAETILSQSFKDWEWIFIDDASTEPVSEYIRSLGDSRIRLHRNTETKRQTDSLNRGIQLSTSSWIVRMDADDRAHPDRLQETFDCIQRYKEKYHRDPPLIFSDYEVIDELGNLIAEINFKNSTHSNFYSYLQHRNNPLCHPTVTFKKFSPLGELYLFSPELKNAQDFDLWKRIYKSNPHVPYAHIPKPLIQYRLVRHSLSGAGNPEQNTEVQAIREGKFPSLSLASKKTLKATEQEGMHAYRILYYKLIGNGKETGLPTLVDVQLLLKVFQYPRMFKKAALYLAARICKPFSKRFLFSGIYK